MTDLKVATGAKSQNTKSLLQARTYPRRAFLAYNAHRTRVDILALKEHIHKLYKELESTRARIAEVELEKRANTARIPRIAEVEELFDQKDRERKWEEDNTHIRGDQSANKIPEVEETEDEEVGRSGNSETWEDVYVLDGGDTVIRVREIEGDEKEGNSEFFVQLSRVNPYERYKSGQGVVVGTEEDQKAGDDGGVCGKDGKMSKKRLDELAELGACLRPRVDSGILTDIQEDEKEE